VSDLYISLEHWYSLACNMFVLGAFHCGDLRLFESLNLKGTCTLELLNKSFYISIISTFSLNFIRPTPQFS